MRLPVCYARSSARLQRGRRSDTRCSSIRLCHRSQGRAPSNMMRMARCSVGFRNACWISIPRRDLGFANKILTAPSIARRLRAEAPDIIYYRQQGPWYPGLRSILRAAPCVMEVNANFEEADQWGGLLKWYARTTRHATLSSLAGFVCVSEEIAAELADLGRPAEAIPNSMWGSPELRLPPSDNQAPSFVFVGSPLMGTGSWHGIDKLFPLARALPESAFHIVGLTREGFAGYAIPANVRFHGPLYGDDLVDIYRQSDIGIGTLALHRRKIDQTSALKPLEYLMYGLPIILGYRETKSALNTAPYTLSIDNTEDNVARNLDPIRRFADAWRGKRVTADLSYLSGAVIEARRLAFLQSFVRTPKPVRGAARIKAGGSLCS